MRSTIDYQIFNELLHASRDLYFKVFINVDINYTCSFCYLYLIDCKAL